MVKPKKPIKPEARAPKNPSPTIRRGSVHWIELDKPRPCVVVSSEAVLSVDVWQTHVVPLTSNVERAGIAGNVLLRARLTGLPRDSVAVPLGLELVDRARLSNRTRQLPSALIEAIDDGLRQILDL